MKQMQRLLQIFIPYFFLKIVFQIEMIEFQNSIQNWVSATGYGQKKCIWNCACLGKVCPY